MAKEENLRPEPMRRRLLVPSLALLTTLAGCGPSSLSCEGLNAAQTSDAARTCVFAARIGDDGFESFGDEPETFALAGAPLTPDDRTRAYRNDRTEDGLSLTARNGVVTWNQGNEALRRDSVGPVGGVAVSASGRWAIDIARGPLWIGEPDGRRSVELAAEGGAMQPVGVVEGTGEPALWMPNVVRLAFSPDGTRLARAEDDDEDTLAVWDAVSGVREWAVPVGGDARVLAFSPDGALVAVGTLDAVRLWDAATGAPRATWSVPRRVEAVTFEGDHLVTWFASKQTAKRLASGVSPRPDDHFVRSNSDGSTEVLSTSPPAVAVWRLPG